MANSLSSPCSKFQNGSFLCNGRRYQPLHFSHLLRRDPPFHPEDCCLSVRLIIPDCFKAISEAFVGVYSMNKVLVYWHDLFGLKGCSVIWTLAGAISSVIQ
ncbi:hypothetical protein M569_17028 [Genlisea aurea]|uniref:Uncharacterized protein n=1 Tax=Genlisea aurea TaxID=192259 RepID=S8BTS1_9LAMI|nr:hypothetical protein M569_17028 [Genlisea aurea]